MPHKGYQQISGLVLVFGIFLLSNASAFFCVCWFSPKLKIYEFALWFILVAICVWRLEKNSKISFFLEHLRRNWIILPFTVFAGLSILWSVYWQISLYRWLILLFTIVAGGYIGLNLDMEKLMEWLSVFGVYILLASAALVFFAPGVGIMNYSIIQGAWKGVYWHKNHMGLIASFINILFLMKIIASVHNKKKQAIFLGIMYLFSLLFVAYSDSVAAYFVSILLHGVILGVLLLLKYRSSIRSSHYLIISAVVILASLLLYKNMDGIFGIFNRNTSLTGRIPMWSHLFNAYFNKQPYAGYGFNAFWYLESHRVAMQQAVGYLDPIVIADNGFIDIMVNTGYVGFFLFLIFYFGAWWRSIKFAKNAREISGYFPIILMSYTLLANLSWSLIFENEGFFMLVLVSVLFCISGDTTFINEDS